MSADEAGPSPVPVRATFNYWEVAIANALTGLGLFKLFVSSAQLPLTSLVSFVLEKYEALRDLFVLPVEVGLRFFFQVIEISDFARTILFIGFIFLAICVRSYLQSVIRTRSTIESVLGNGFGLLVILLAVTYLTSQLFLDPQPFLRWLSNMAEVPLAGYLLGGGLITLLLLLIWGMARINGDIEEERVLLMNTLAAASWGLAWFVLNLAS